MDSRQRIDLDDWSFRDCSSVAQFRQQCDGLIEKIAGLLRSGTAAKTAESIDVQAAAEQEVTLLGVEILGPQELPVVVMQPGEGVARRCRVEVVEGRETANGEFGGVAHGEASHGFMGLKYG